MCARQKKETDRAGEGWRSWDIEPSYGDLLYDRAVGDLPEMESAKSLCELIKGYYKSGQSVLDVGCGSGHYLLSLKKRVDDNIKYTGVDATDYYLQLAKKAFQDKYSFVLGDVLNLQFSDNSFDIVMSNNLIHHLPAPPRKALSELIRVAKQTVIIRTVIGKRNYLIKELYTSDELSGKSSDVREIFDSDGQPRHYYNYNMLTQDYFKSVINEINPKLNVEFKIDDQWQNFDNRKDTKNETATLCVDGKQITGNLVQDWQFIIISKNI